MVKNPNLTRFSLVQCGQVSVIVIAMNNSTTTHYQRIENVFPEVRVQVILGSAEKGTGVLPDLDTELQNSSSEI